MAQAIFVIKLDWKTYHVDLDTVSQWMYTNHGDSGFCGIQAANQVEMWFTAIPPEAEQDAIRAYWDGITETSAEVTNYKSAALRLAEAASSKAALQASASAKLKSLGLTDDEIAAMVG